ncbi:serine/threonine-protein phosphatase [Chitinophagales bacterium]|nr:serine/threonine-protein phosphatase [Chitinophagales bacterium]
MSQNIPTLTTSAVLATVQYKQLELDALLEVTKAINQNASAEKLYKIYGFTLLAQMNVKKVAIVYLAEDGWELCFQQGLGEDERLPLFELEKWKEQAGNIVFIKDAEDLRLSNHFDILLPVRHKTRHIAFAMIGNLKSVAENQIPASLEDKLKFIQTLTNIIVVAVENKRLFKLQREKAVLEKEMATAKDVQQMLIPKKLAGAEHLDMAAIYRPHHSIGGDYYDVIEIDDDHLLFCMADVSGKGISAALIMANFQAMLRVLSKEKSSLTELVHILNKGMFDITSGERFITVFLGIYNKNDGSIRYINAGHPPAVLVKEDGHIKELTKGCTILGAFPKLKHIEEGEATLSKNSMFIVYTDGLTELTNESEVQFEQEGLYDFLREQKKLDANIVLDELIACVNKYKGSLDYSDDISVLCARRIA